MSPAIRDPSQTPEPKSNGLVSAFKSLTGTKSTKSPSLRSQASVAQQLNSVPAPKNAVFGGPSNYDSLCEQLKPERALSERIAAAEALSTTIVDYPISGVTNVFRDARDLIESSKPQNARQAGYKLLSACTQHTAASDPERLAYFKTITAPAPKEDFGLQLGAIIKLARSGREVSGFHYQIFALLAQWLDHAFLLATTARKGRQRNPKSKSVLVEEGNLLSLFEFIADVVKFNFNVSSEETAAGLIDAILSVSALTPSPVDLKACINVVDAIVTYGEIPGPKLAECVTVLCSIYCLIDKVLQREAWRSIRNLCHSHNGQTTIRILLDILRQQKSAQNEGQNEGQFVREIRGALAVLERLFGKDGVKAYPLVPFTVLTEALSHVMRIEHGKFEADVLRMIVSLFSDNGKGLPNNLLEEDWSDIFTVAAQCAQHALSTSDGRLIATRARGPGTLIDTAAPKEESDSGIAKELDKLITRIEELLLKPPSPDFFQRAECIDFFISVHAHLPDSCARMAIDHYNELRACYPSDENWRENIKLILQAFFADRSQLTHVRLHALRAVTDVFDVLYTMDQARDPEAIQALMTGILHDVSEERDIVVLQEVVDFSVAVVATSDQETCDWVISALRSCVKGDRMQSPLSSPPTNRSSLLEKPSDSNSTHRLAQSPSDVATQGMVKIFILTVVGSPGKAGRVFHELIAIAKSHDNEPDARLSALRLLFRLRADWANRIFVTNDTESKGLATCLFRTSESLARKQAVEEAAQGNRSMRGDDAGRASRNPSLSQVPQSKVLSRMASGTIRSPPRHHNIWMYPDQDRLPSIVNDTASSVLVAHVEHGMADATHGQMHRKLPIGDYLDTIMTLLEHGCDWEIYSYILVNLAAQLTNHALFRSTSTNINALRNLLCQQIRQTSFHDPPVSSGVRRADVAICLFQSLTMVVSYHQYFNKVEEDELVRTFMQGLGAERAAKCCIHALSVCCHELPASTSKVLATILQKMSQIITQSHVAVHIMEFLTSLSRMPDLFVNFREDEYKTVLAVSFRYLQYVRDQNNKEATHRISLQNPRVPLQEPSRILSSLAGVTESNFAPNTSDDVPQYVFALAYQSIIFWFLNIKLSDRGQLVAWISKNLITSDTLGKERMDEQSQVIMDFLQRVAYADVDESALDPDFNTDKFGKISRRRWIVGHSIIDVEQAARGGWAQITKRQPSSTSRFVVRTKFTRRPQHQVQTAGDASRGEQGHPELGQVLPSHMFLQFSSVPQGADNQRPIALPDDDMIRRAIAAFDRNSTVDGHKVGVIYIGEKQTDEVTILSNVSGSNDYNVFMEGLGILTKLKGATFNTQGLDREYNTDGEFAYCWRDRVTEVVFHTTTQMPTDLKRDPQCINKKRHIGNDFVNIIYNNSGLPFRFDTFPSEFNYVNIVIAPESRISFVARHMKPKNDRQYSFFKVQVLSKPGFPEISPAAEPKIVSLAALPSYVRLLALNACVFALVWASRDGADHVSPWRNRLREIKKLKDKYAPKIATPTPVSPPGSSSGIVHASRNVGEALHSLANTTRRSSIANMQLQYIGNSSESNSARSSLLSTAETDVGSGIGGEDNLMESYDFSKWA